MGGTAGIRAPARTWTEVRYPSDVLTTVRALAGGGELAWLDCPDPAEDAREINLLAPFDGTSIASRWSLVACDPLAVVTQPALGKPAALHVGEDCVQQDANGLRLWEIAQRRVAVTAPRAAGPAADGPFGDAPLGPGWIGALSFEAAGLCEPGLFEHSTPLPILRWSLFDSVVLLDARMRRAAVLHAPSVRAALGLPARDARQLADRWESACRATPEPTGLSQPCTLLADQSADAYQARVRRALDYVTAGDIYQVNLAQRWRIQRAGDPLARYAALRRANPAPRAALLKWTQGGTPMAVVSASPELFLHSTAGCVRSSPIKGTRRRDPRDTPACVRELLASDKDRAELAMVVDLHRNDLGRVCEFGSVRVASPRRVELHPTVVHTVADVVGHLRPGVTPFELLAACFPAGSISGVPKRRALQIIRELEPVPRGVYTGASGWLGLDGRLILNVAIRTLQFHGDEALLYAGGGIVADSDPALEYAETLAKVAGLLAAFELSELPVSQPRP